MKIQLPVITSAWSVAVIPPALLAGPAGGQPSQSLAKLTPSSRRVSR